VASIGGSQIESQNSRGVVAVSSSAGEITESDLARVIDAAKAVSLPSSRQILHVLPRNYAVDGQEGIKDPLGMIGIRLEVDTHIISAASPSLSNLEKVFSQVGIDIDGVAFSGYASSLAVLSETEKELGVVLVDIGAGTTDISIYSEGSVAYSSVLPIGARHITNDLAIGLRVSLESAEKIKLALSSAPQIAVEPIDNHNAKDIKTSDHLDIASLSIDEDLKMVSKKTLIDGIMKPRLREIMNMIKVEIQKSSYSGLTPSGVVLTGGGSMTVGMVDLAKQELEMPVRVGFGQNATGLIDEISSPIHSASLGLAIYGASYQQEEVRLPLVGRIEIKGLFNKGVNLIKSILP